jgi:hypothetical protein
MPKGLKLKQASAVLQVEPKELQNLVQFGVVKPRRSAGTYLFDINVLLAAKVALCLKESLGTGTRVLCKLMSAFSAREQQFKAKAPNYVFFSFRYAPDDQPVRLGIPFRALEEQVEEQMSRLDLYRDLPRGRKRRGWQKEFLQTLTAAAKDIGDISDDEILRTIRNYRREKRTSEITVVAEN